MSWYILVAPFILAAIAYSIYKLYIFLMKNTDFNKIRKDIENIQKSSKKCTFPGQDIYNNKIYTIDGNPLKSNTKVSCNDCDNYYYRDDKKCVKYEYNNLYSRGNDLSLCMSEIGLYKNCKF